MPGTVAGLIPAVIILSGSRDIEPLTAALGAVLLAAGLALVAWTIALFIRVGRGTLAPWAPPTRLVVRGPYRYVRNPMITGVGTVLAGEALFFRSVGVAVELAIFAALNAIYFPLVEEPDLRERFGAEYDDYRARVPRWLPRWRS